MKRIVSGSVFALFLALFSVFSVGAAEEATAEQFVVYYPHNTFRCYSCNMIETLTKAAIEGGTLEGKDGKDIKVDNSALTKLLKNKKLVFRSVNVDEPEQANLLADLKTKAKMPALAKVVGGKIMKAQPLDQAWNLLSGEPEAFFKYVQDETLKFVNSNQ